MCYDVHHFIDVCVFQSMQRITEYGVRVEVLCVDTCRPKPVGYIMSNDCVC
jgi:hypothetical protein